MRRFQTKPKCNFRPVTDTSGFTSRLLLSCRGSVFHLSGQNIRWWRHREREGLEGIARVTYQAVAYLAANADDVWLNHPGR